MMIGSRMMSNLLMAGLAWSAGIGLGAMFFGGLWWTVRRGVSSEYPALWFFVSVVLRTGLVLAGFYLASGGAWTRLLWCLLGFVMARVGVIWLTRYAPANLPRPVSEPDHAA